MGWQDAPLVDDSAVKPAWMSAPLVDDAPQPPLGFKQQQKAERKAYQDAGGGVLPSIGKGFTNLKGLLDLAAMGLEKTVTGDVETTAPIFRGTLETLGIGKSDPIAGHIAQAWNEGSAGDVADVLTDNPMGLVNYLSEMIPGAIPGGVVGGVGAKYLAGQAVNRFALPQVVKTIAPRAAAGAGANAGATFTGGSVPSISSAYEENLSMEDATRRGLTQTGVESAVAAPFGAFLPFGRGIPNILAKAGIVSPADEMAQTYFGNAAIGKETSQGELAASALLGAPSGLGDIAMARWTAGKQPQPTPSPDLDIPDAAPPRPPRETPTTQLPGTIAVDSKGIATQFDAAGQPTDPGTIAGYMKNEIERKVKAELDARRAFDLAQRQAETKQSAQDAEPRNLADVRAGGTASAEGTAATTPESFTFFGAKIKGGQMTDGERVEIVQEGVTLQDAKGKDVQATVVRFPDREGSPEMPVPADKLTTLSRPANPRFAQDIAATSYTPKKGVGTGPDQPAPRTAAQRITTEPTPEVIQAERTTDQPAPKQGRDITDLSLSQIGENNGTENVATNADVGVPRLSVKGDNGGGSPASSVLRHEDGVRDTGAGNPILTKPAAVAAKSQTVQRQGGEQPADIAEFSPKPGDQPDVPRHAADKLAVQETPLNDLTLSKDVPQFKKGANEKGVVSPLGGKFDRAGLAPIQVWERLNGDMEIISGRHRYDLARRSGEETIPTQVHREADGFTAKDAATIDAELNIRDEQGGMADYATYFRDSGITEEAANVQGLLARAKGKGGFAIARDASKDLYAAHSAGVISDEAALAISRAAPKSDALQAVGMKLVNEGKSITLAENTVRAIGMMQKNGEVKSEQGDIFGFDDSAIREAESMARRASTAQRELREQIAAVSGAAKRPEIARRLGVDAKDPEAIKAKIAEMKQEVARMDNWPVHPDLVARFRGEKPAEPAQPLVLESQSESQLRAADQARVDAKRKAAAEETAAEQKAQTDRETKDFTLTGSDRAADSNPNQSTLYGGFGPVNKVAEAIAKIVGVDAKGREAWHDWSVNLAHGLPQVLKRVMEKPDSGQNAAVRVVRSLWHDMHTNLGIAIDKAGGSKTATYVRDQFGFDVGKGEAVGPTVQEATDRHLKAVMKPFKPTVERIQNIIDAQWRAGGKSQSKNEISDKVWTQIRAQVMNKGSRQGEMGKAANEIAALLKAEYDYQKAAGVELGDQGAEYFPHSLDARKISGSEAAFIADASKAFRTELGMSKEDADAAAARWLDRELHGGRMTLTGGSGAAKPSHVKERVFKAGGSGEKIMAKWYEADGTDTLLRYILNSGKRAEIATRFGDNFSRWADYVDENGKPQKGMETLMREEGAGPIIEDIKNYVMEGAGIAPRDTSSYIAKAASVVRTSFTLGALEGSALVNLLETVSPFVTTNGNLRAGLESISLTSQAVLRGLKILPETDRFHALKDFAEDHAIISGVMMQRLNMDRFHGAMTASNWEKKILEGFFQKNLMNGLTESQRITDVGVGQVYIRRLAKAVMGKTLIATPNESARVLRDFGIPKGKEKEFSAWLDKHGDKLPTLADGNKDLMARLYANAIGRFVDTTSLKGDAVTRPAYANTTYGAMVYQLTNYTNLFHKYILRRIGQQMKAAADPKETLSLVERASLAAGPLPGLFLMGAAGAALFELKDKATEEITGKKPNLSEEAKLERSANAANLMGRYSRPFEAIAAQRYGGGGIAAGMIAPGIVAQSGKTVDAAWRAATENENSNAGERAFMKLFYKGVLEPTFQAGMSMTPFSPITSAATILVPAAMQEPFVKATAGKESNKAKKLREREKRGVLEVVLDKKKPANQAAAR